MRSAALSFLGVARFSSFDDEDDARRGRRA
jgi:hypothetical protein